MNVETARPSTGTGGIESAGGPDTRVQRETCPECGSRLAAIGWRHCTPCLRDLVAGLNRRRAAEQRLRPLVDFSEAS